MDDLIKSLAPGSSHKGWADPETLHTAEYKACGSSWPLK